MRKGLDRASASALAKLLVFIVVTSLATTLLAITIGNISFEDRTEYKAVFEDTTGLIKGDDIRVAGVRVGTVSNVEIVNRDEAEVTMSIAEDTPLTEGTEATIKYRNLIGQRYISLSEGDEAENAALETGDTLPKEQTNEALDLTVLFNGFKPLFEGLSPEDTNKLSYELIQVLQGEAGTVHTLLDRTASVTQTFAKKDKLIGNVIDNFNDLLGTLNNRDKELSNTIVTLQKFMTGLNDDSDAITSAIESIDDLTVETGGFLQDARPALTADIKNLRSLAEQLNDPAVKGELDDVLKILPIKLDRVGSTVDFAPFGAVVPCEVSTFVKMPAIPGVPGYEKPQTYKPTGSRVSMEERCGE